MVDEECWLPGLWRPFLKKYLTSCISVCLSCRGVLIPLLFNLTTLLSDHSVFNTRCWCWCPQGYILFCVGSLVVAFVDAILVSPSWDPGAFFLHSLASFQNSFFVANLAALLWTFTRRFFSFSRCGSHATAEYSKIGHTMVIVSVGMFMNNFSRLVVCCVKVTQSSCHTCLWNIYPIFLL